MSLWQELQRRKVVRVAAVYAVTAWILVQIVTAIAEPLSLPDWIDTFVIVVLGVRLSRRADFELGLRRLARRHRRDVGPSVRADSDAHGCALDALALARGPAADTAGRRLSRRR
jgi:hypothetical protein